MNKYVIYTDGASRGNPGPGASSYVVLDSEEQYEINYKSIFFPSCTNNHAELSAIIDALEFISKNTSLDEKQIVVIKSDSEYCVNGCTQWMYSWKRQGTLSERPNGELWKTLYDLIQEIKRHILKLEFIHVKGHSGVHWNEYVDKLCNKALDECQGIEKAVDTKTVAVEYKRKLDNLSETIVIDDIRTDDGGISLISTQVDKEFVIKFGRETFQVLKMLLKS